MPELAEVEYYRKQWDRGHGDRVTRLHLNEEKRVFRGTDLDALKRLVGQRLKGSEAAGKQMLFRFGKESWVGIHLGMTGKLSSAGAEHHPSKHDHLVIFLRRSALIFTDARQFGRVQIHEGKQAPEWWARISPAVTSEAFTMERMDAFLERRGKSPVKGALLSQEGFPGVGNWMADEILWRAGILPGRRCAEVNTEERRRLHREVRTVARIALEKIGSDFGDPPKNWLFHVRWGRGGVCPKHKTELKRGVVATRTTVWCPRCQK